MGGKVGLKGTDNVLKTALERGATPCVRQRVLQALLPLAAVSSEICLVTCDGDMGKAVVSNQGFDLKIVHTPLSSDTTSEDTVIAARRMQGAGVDLILFAGGDGTARDICRAVTNTVPVLGIPAGVKIHSPVFALNPAKAGDLASRFLQGKIQKLLEAEVLDIDEDVYRKGQVCTRLYGYMNIPLDRESTQNRKAGTPLSEKAAQNLISLDIIDRMIPDTLYIIGPGSTTRPVMENLGLENTLLGVDLVMNKQIVKNDASEQDILFHMKDRPCRILITPTGGQGYLLGRGNQQISSKVLSTIPRDHIMVAATKEKVFNLQGTPLRVDTGDSKIDQKLSGYVRIITGYKEELVYPVV